MKHTLLIIDDNEAILRLLKQFLIRIQCLYSLRRRGGIVFLFSGIKPDLIISDLNMDNINGYELINHLSTSNIFSKIPIIIISGIGEKDSLLFQKTIRNSKIFK